MKSLHLVCNAHIDPVWLWEWEEGASSAISTFRSAVVLAGEYDYIFCHNEVLLYRWVEEYDPGLFAGIKALVKAGKWRVIGGWYLQPDCNMPSGESFIRQIGEGRRYFSRKLGQEPRTAVNFDSFGHSFGLPQILRKTGYESYLCCRPSPAEFPVPDFFMWEGVDGTQIPAARVSAHYNSALGHAMDKIRGVLENSICDVSIVLWGVGNHGGGPSRKDLEDIKSFIEKNGGSVKHSYPEAFFDENAEYKPFKGGINTCMPGCYTSQVRIKQLHRKLESRLYMTEKMLSHAALAGALKYPSAEIRDAQNDLLTAEFHDILPGTGIREVEEYGIRLMQRGIGTLDRLRARAFFALAGGQPPAKPGEYPILVYNPHPYETEAVIDMGFNLADQNYDETFTGIAVYQGEKELPSQVIREKANLNLDWMKRVLFECRLPPMSISRFDCRTRLLPYKPAAAQSEDEISFSNGNMEAAVSPVTGLIDRLRLDGKTYFNADCLKFLVFEDNEDPWAMSPAQHERLGELRGSYSLMDEIRAAEFCGALKEPVRPLRIIEDGDVCTVAESLLCYNGSAVRLELTFYKHKNEIDVHIDSFFFEKNKTVKLFLPFAFEGEVYNDIAFGRERIEKNGMERSMHKYILYAGGGIACGVINRGVYGMSADSGGVYITLVRGAAYAAHPIRDRDITPRDRYTGRMDQGERNYDLKLIFGNREEVEETIDRKACEFNEGVFALCSFPSGGEEVAQGIARVIGKGIIMSALKKSDRGGYVARLHNNTDKQKEAAFELMGKQIEISFRPFEFKTLIYRRSRLYESLRAET